MPIPSSHSPILSIITVVRNNAEGLARTLQSIRDQSYVNYELIVVDGDSDDSTVSVLEDWSEFVTVLISEPDKGPYDGMNKGLSKATGEWVIFLNSGDYFSNGNVLEIFENNWSCDVLYGSIFVKQPNVKAQMMRPVGNIWKGICFSHQATFIRRSIQEKFSTKLTLVADWAFIEKIIREGGLLRNVNLPITVVEPGGISSAFLKRTMERYWIAKKHYPDKPVTRHYVGLTWAVFRKSLARYWRKMKKRPCCLLKAEGHL